MIKHQGEAATIFPRTLARPSPSIRSRIHLVGAVYQEIENVILS